MDPITTASRNFFGRAETFWRSGGNRVLLMVAAPAYRLDLAKFLRAKESSLDNRWPLFLYEQPFVDIGTYLAELQQRLKEDYAAIRAGAAAEGVALDPYGTSEPANASASSFSAAMERVATLLGPLLDGLHLALLPSRIEQPEIWTRLIGDFRQTAFSPRVRVAIHDVPGGVLGSQFPSDAHVRFEVNEAELLDFFRQAGSQKSAGPPRKSSVPEMTNEQRAQVEQRLGRRLLTPQAGGRLKDLLLDATQLNREGQHEPALRRYLEAQQLCKAEGAVQEEAMVLLALASGFLAIRDSEQAATAYRKAAELAQSQQLWPLVSQAWLGVGAVLFMNGMILAAAEAYEQAAVAAQQAQVPMLRIEALRMAGTCHHQIGRTSDVMRCWQSAVEEGEALPGDRRQTTTLPQVAEDFVRLLRKHGLPEQARHVQSLIDGSTSTAAAGV
jgi:tetratricopeptide (TPR) repeat protein